MTNFEWLMSERKDFLKELLTKHEYLGVKEDGEVALCHDIDCDNCCFQNNCVGDCVGTWLEAEHNSYTIPVSTPIDAKVWVKNRTHDEWVKRYFAGFGKSDEGDSLYKCFDGGNTSWSSDGSYDFWKFCKLAKD